MKALQNEGVYWVRFSWTDITTNFKKKKIQGRFLSKIFNSPVKSRLTVNCEKQKKQTLHRGSVLWKRYNRFYVGGKLQNRFLQPILTGLADEPIIN